VQKEYSTIPAHKLKNKNKNLQKKAKKNKNKLHSTCYIRIHNYQQSILVASERPIRY
jgi:hypothetical protein